MAWTKQRSMVAVAAGAALLAGVAVWTRGHRVAPGVARWRAGEERTYGLALASQIEGQQMRLLDLTLGGRWAVAALRVGTESLFRAELREVSLRLASQSSKDDAALAELRAALARPLFFALDGRGALVDVRLPPGGPALAGQILKSVAASVQLVMPAEGGSSRWLTEEIDGVGRYRAEYRLGGGAIEKRKLAYLPANAGAPQTDIDSARATFRLTEGRISALDSEERTRVAAKGVLPSLASHTTLSLVLESAGDVAEREALAVQAERAPRSRPFDPPAADPLQQRQIDEVKAAGLTVRDIVGRLGALPPAGDERTTAEARLFSALAAVLRIDGSAVADVAARIRAGGPLTDLLVSALGTAGTAEAQAALGDLFRGTTGDPRLGQNILISLSLVQAPTEASIDLLAALADDPYHGRQAVYGLGSFAHELAGPDPALASAVLGRIYDRLSAGDPEQTAAALVALGNAGAAEALEKIEPHLESPLAGVRAAAVRALRLVPGDRVDGLLGDMMKGDADATVRSNAVSAAADRPYSDRLAQGVDWSARRDPEARIRYASLGVLVRWQQSAPAVRGTIALLAATDGNDEIRRAAARALNGTFGRSP